MAFDDLTPEQQAKILEIADKEIEHDKKVKEYTDKVKSNINTEFKDFLSRKGEFDESDVPTDQLTYDDDKVVRVQNISGQYIERCMVTLDNNYQVSITRPTQVYGSNPNIFDISPRKPDGELDTTLIDPTQINQDVLPGQTITDISKHIDTLAQIDPEKENKQKEDDSK